MNAARIAQLFRELAAEFDSEAPAARPSEARPAPETKVQITDTDRARARKALRRIGV